MSKNFIQINSDENITNYFKDIKDSTYLSSEKEVELAGRIKNGDKEALDELVTANLKFVITIAKEYQGQGLQFSDLISEGNLGLIKAATRFDPTRGFRFISYAVWWIRQSILYSLNNNSRTIRFPSNIINKISQTKKMFEKFESINERDVDYVDFMDNSEIIDYVSLPNCTSLNQVVVEDGSELGDLIKDETINTDDILNESKSQINEELSNILSQLDDREREIIEYYFGLSNDYNNMTLEVIGEKYGLTKERIRQIKERGLKKLRHNSGKLFDIMNN